MYKKYFFTILVTFYCFLSNAQQNSDLFYYCFDEKIFPKQITDKICLKFAPNVHKGQLHALIESDKTLRSMSDAYLEEDRPLSFVILEAGEGRQISSFTIESFKARDEIISVEYLLQPISGSGKFSAFTDEFVVKLKETVSYAQLQELAKQYHCDIGEENRFVKNKFKLYVSKTSALNSKHVKRVGL